MVLSDAEGKRWIALRHARIGQALNGTDTPSSGSRFSRSALARAFTPTPSITLPDAA